MNSESKHEPVFGHSDVQVQMVREDLDTIPVFGLPSGYRIRWYEVGDEVHWLRIHNTCEGYGDLKAGLFEDQYGTDQEVLSQRMAFICREDGLPVSTNTAWMNDWNDAHWGRIHWVATSREEQGKGLSKPLMTAVCKRLVELGHDRAYLTTNTLRVRAIALYAAFGFRAYWETEREQMAWEDLNERMGAIGRKVSFGSV